MARFNRRFASAFERLLRSYERRGPRLAAAVRDAWSWPSPRSSAASLMLYPLLGVAFFPRTDAGQFVVNPQVAVGDEDSNSPLRTCGRSRRSFDVSSTRAISSSSCRTSVSRRISRRSTPATPAPHASTIQVALKDDHRIGSYEYMARVRTAIRPGAAASERVLPVRRHGRRRAQSGVAGADRRAGERVEPRRDVPDRQRCRGEHPDACPA